jgi:hypothetical protein
VVAAEYLEKIQPDGGTQHDDDITGYALRRFNAIPEVRLLVSKSPRKPRASVFIRG